MARLSFKTVCKGTALLLFFIILGLNAQSNTDITSLPVTLSITSTEENTSSQALSTTTAPATTSSPSTESQTSVSTTAPVTTSSLLNETQTSSPTSIFIHGHLTASVTTSSPSTESQTSASTTAPVTTSSLLTTTQTSSPTTAPVTTSSLLTTTQTSTSTTAPVTTSSLLTTTQTSSPTTSVTTSSSSTESQTSASTTAPVTTSSLLTTTQTSSPTTASVTTSSSSTESQTSASTTATATTSSPSTLQSQTSSPTTATATTSSPSTVQSQTSASTTAPVTTNSLLTTTQTSTPTTAPVTTSSLLTTTQTSTPTTASVTTSSPSTLQSQTSASTTAPVTTNSLLTTTQTSTPTTAPVTTSSLLTTTQTSSPTTATATTSSPSTFQSESSASTTAPVTTSSLLTTTQTSSPTTPANTSSLSPESKKSASTAATASTSSPSTKSQTSATTSSSKTESNTWLIVGIVLAVIFFFFIIILTLFFCSRRQTKKQCPDILAHTISNNISIALRIEDYEEYFKQKHKDSNCGFAEEYEELKTVGTAQSKNTALAIENKPKNRYGNVLPYDVSRVKLSMCGSLLDDYINANYIPGYNSRKEFIAAQGPLPVTVNEFWRMVWEKNVHTIVMLTRCNEMGRVKCEKYWPSGTNHYENFSVTTTSEIELESWTIRDFTIKNVKTAETRYIRQFHFTAWPDHGVPQTTEVLIDFRHLVREHMDQYSRHSPAVVHCSAGVGRTGTFIAIDHLIFQIERDSMVDIYGIVNDMRMHRPLMVQTEEQYVYLHQSAYDIIRSRTGSNMDLIYQNAIELSVYQNVQYQKL
ncbi:receptor-type tyrosine-protein phosphatase eta-like isoform X9 [Puntigrus tetrazona]|uniref:receptor-type tyrosine-protein phosphatase eta-like isoform X9 n=1 Tax=Puntigrus tetrazona TaxID=1606681 RepID=UPI001C893A1B|nr:receptor-type tyrosine-protein phosphatase eta-like isoform X9 [Puntigrus tetrazona]